MTLITSWKNIWLNLRANWLAMIGLGLILLLILTAVFAPYLARKDPLVRDKKQSLKPPSTEYWLGTDLLGRDLYSRLVYGSRVSLIVGLIATGIMVFIGLAVGSLAGYYGGFLDSILMRLTDVFLSFPYVLGAIALISVLETEARSGLSFYVIFTNVSHVFIAIGLLGWPMIARIIRSTVLSVKELDYVTAARALGAKDARIIVRHILPNSIQPVIIYGMMAIGAAIITEAALSYLGIGVQIPTPSWGQMLAASRGYYARAPWTMLFPGLAITLAVLGFILLGDGLRDALNPKLKG